jgi:hypothetical protein
VVTEKTTTANDEDITKRLSGSRDGHLEEFGNEFFGMNH